MREIGGGGGGGGGEEEGQLPSLVPSTAPFFPDHAVIFSSAFHLLTNSLSSLEKAKAALGTRECFMPAAGCLSNSC